MVGAPYTPPVKLYLAIYDAEFGQPRLEPLSYAVAKFYDPAAVKDIFDRINADREAEDKLCHMAE